MMFSKIMVPVDLTQLDALSRALDVASELAKSHGSEIIYVSITGGAPSSTAHNPVEFSAKLKEFAAEQATSRGIKTRAMPIESHDPEIEIGSRLVEAAEKAGADVVVMASHIPSWVEHIFHSNAGYVACHSKASVFVIR